MVAACRNKWVFTHNAIIMCTIVKVFGTYMMYQYMYMWLTWGAEFVLKRCEVSLKVW